jgi:hypothetical protein
MEDSRVGSLVFSLLNRDDIDPPEVRLAVVVLAPGTGRRVRELEAPAEELSFLWSSPKF